jgi:hypothetical protein
MKRDLQQYRQKNKTGILQRTWYLQNVRQEIRKMERDMIS